jgi:uncharacterized protein (TIGR01244 family)
MAMHIRPLTDDFAVSPQLRPADVAEAAAQGYTTIINNRPDGEGWGQPKNADIEASALALNLNYYHLPISLRGLTPEQVQDQARITETSKGPILAFCNTGTRSATVWALTQAGKMDADAIIEAAAKAGYKLHHLREYLG